MGIVYRALMLCDDELRRVSGSLAKAPLVDAAGRRLRITVERMTPVRSVEQNALMWVLLTAIAAQVQWPVNGQMVWLEPEDWKEILTAGLRKSQRVAQGVEGGFVLLGTSTSSLDKQAMSELIEFLFFFGANHSVDFGNESRQPEIAAPQTPAALTHETTGVTA